MNANVTAFHPCTYVSDSVQVCIVEDGDKANAANCWSVDKCLARRAFGDSGELDTMSTIRTILPSCAMMPTSVALPLALAVLFALM